MFTEKDLTQIASLGIQKEIIEQQIENFKRGFPFANLVAPATIENKGIRVLSKSELSELLTAFEKESEGKSLLKFIPASGAATRMFKDLYDVLHLYSGDYTAFQREYPEGNTFIQSLKEFAFFDKLKNALAQNGLDIDECLTSHHYTTIINYLLNNKYGLNYGHLPKALLDFHKYENTVRTSMEEHLVEGIEYAQQKDKTVHLHFTVSNEHLELFKEKLNTVAKTYEDLHQIKFNVSFSEQKHSTDTIAVSENNELFRDADGNLVFRPGGHGALIENLNDCDADIIFIKNIDNVVPDRLKEETYLYKKACGGLLISLQEKIFSFLRLLENETVTEKQLIEIENFIREELNLNSPEDYNKKSISEKREILRQKLNCPIRICGMVKNVGEPGGGPFFVSNADGEVSLQIIESSQINHNHGGQEVLFKSSTHFNPVDLICGIKDYKGQKFNLKNFIDPETGFISKKSKDGKVLKAQELPGLWNGAMANWITLFVEVPLITFNPVKTVNDLLRKEHQN